MNGTDSTDMKSSKSYNPIVTDKQLARKFSIGDVDRKRSFTGRIALVNFYAGKINAEVVGKMYGLSTFTFGDSYGLPRYSSVSDLICLFKHPNGLFWNIPSNNNMNLVPENETKQFFMIEKKKTFSMINKVLILPSER